MSWISRRGKQSAPATKQRDLRRHLRQLPAKVRLSFIALFSFSRGSCSRCSCRRFFGGVSRSNTDTADSLRRADPRPRTAATIVCAPPASFHLRSRRMISSSWSAAHAILFRRRGIASRSAPGGYRDWRRRPAARGASCSRPGWCNAAQAAEPPAAACPAAGAAFDKALALEFVDVTVPDALWLRPVLDQNLGKDRRRSGRVAVPRPPQPKAPPIRSLSARRAAG